VSEAASQRDDERRDRRGGVLYGIILALIALLIILFLMQCSVARQPSEKAAVTAPPSTSAVAPLPTPQPEPDIPLPDISTAGGPGAATTLADKSAVVPVVWGTVPDIVGKSEAAAKVAIEAAGFRPWQVPRPRPQVLGVVGQQWPAAGSALEKGQDVYFIYGIATK
jgi:hypothetical protein